MKKHSYTKLQVIKLYIALNEETYISLRHQELTNCRNIDDEFYCKHLFVVKHKSKFSCESTILFNISPDIIKENFIFEYDFNNTKFRLTVQYGGN